MKLGIGENIKRMRCERNLTQEELANHFGVSFQTISKWERAEGYPDITMLPALAGYFGVSVDTLIGMDKIAKAEKYEKYNCLWTENNKKGRHQDNVRLMRKAIKEFPNDGLLLVQLSVSLEKLEGSDEEKRKWLQESIALQEQILRYGEDTQIRAATQSNICFAYWKNGQYDKALAQAEKLPNLYKARENVLVYFLQGDEKRKVAKEALFPLAWSLSHHLSALAQTEGDPAYYDKAIQILDILFEGRQEEKMAALRKDLNSRKEASCE